MKYKNKLKALVVVSICFSLIVNYMGFNSSVQAANYVNGTINAQGVNMRSGPGREYSVVATSDLNEKVLVDKDASANDKDGALWYYVQTYIANTNTYKWVYVHSMYVEIVDYVYDEEFENHLNSQGFPEDYKEKLRILHQQHPNWSFKALHTGLNFTDAVNAESVYRLNLIDGNDVHYRNPAYPDPVDGTSWYQANSQTIAYYLDPRNFLNNASIMMFQEEGFNAEQNEVAVQSILNGTFMSANAKDGSGKYSSLFYNAGKNNLANPVYLAMRARQEQGAVEGRAMSGASFTHNGTSYPGGYYNIFNIGAYAGADPVANGLYYAMGKDSVSYGRPWNSIAKTINGGSQFIASSYIAKGQNTLYLQKFNVSPHSSYPIYTHQYMQNVRAAASEASGVYNTYANLGLISSPLEFSIPIYKNMPSSTSLPEKIEGGWLLSNGNWYYYVNGEPIKGWYFVNNNYYYFDSSGVMQIGWKLIAGKWYYFNNGGNMHKGFLTLNGETYYLQSDGSMATGLTKIDNILYFFDTVYGNSQNGWIEYDGNDYYFDLDGKGHLGWLFEDGKYYYFQESGVMYKGWLNDTYYLNENGVMLTGWQIIEGNRYFFNSGGAKQTDGFAKDGEDIYYLQNGKAVESQWIIIGSDWYYCKADGKLAKGFTDIGKVTYYLDDNGKMYKGWLWKDNQYYYLDPTYGSLVKGWLNDTYYLNENGVMLTGWKIIEGNRYFFNSGGAKQTQGFAKDGEDIYYLQNGKAVESQWIIIGSDWYYCKADGKLAKGFTDIGSVTYYLDENGKMYKGWLWKDNQYYYLDPTYGSLVKGWLNDTYYLNENGVMLTGWKIIEGNRYFFNSGGAKQTQGFAKDGEDIYYLQNGKAVENQWIIIGSDWYYFKAGGKAAKGFTDIGKVTYYLDDNGKMYKGWLWKDNQYYYLDPTYGSLVKGWLNDTYYLNENGVMLTGWQMIEGNRYFFNSGGAKQTHGFAKDGEDIYYLQNGKAVENQWIITGSDWYYFKADGKAAKGFIDIGSVTYYLDENGKMYKGWLLKNNQYYYLDPTYGSLVKGWKTIQNEIYYFGNAGVMVTGEQVIDGKSYYFNDNGTLSASASSDGLVTIEGKTYYYIHGAKATGWHYIKEGWYYFNAEGIMQTGWLQIGNYWYYLNQNGVMHKGWLYLNNNYYYLDEYGIMNTGWVEVNNEKYYLDMYGIMLKGWQTINNLQYYLEPSGAMADDWTMIDGKKYFFNSIGQEIKGAKKRVIDVSAWQGQIDWDTVYASGQVDGVILRMGTGWIRSQDTWFRYNVDALNRLGIPYGVYYFSYAINVNDAIEEAKNVKSILENNPVNLSYPIYYDLERFDENYYGQPSPATAGEYEAIVLTFIQNMNAFGYSNVKIYSYRNYFQTLLSSEKLKPYIDWVAEYGNYCNYQGNYSGWQYSSSTYIPGIEGRVDSNVWFN